MVHERFIKCDWHSIEIRFSEMTGKKTQNQKRFIFEYASQAPHHTHMASLCMCSIRSHSHRRLNNERVGPLVLNERNATHSIFIDIILYFATFEQNVFD